jgi:hypothetical protein
MDEPFIDLTYTACTSLAISRAYTALVMLLRQRVVRKDGTCGNDRACYDSEICPHGSDSDARAKSGSPASRSLICNFVFLQFHTVNE